MKIVEMVFRSHYYDLQCVLHSSIMSECEFVGFAVQSSEERADRSIRGVGDVGER